ncbi:MAG: response regulator [Gammaproteobacteria bacterium]
MTSTIRILCVDDHPIFRQGLAAVLADDENLDLVAEAATGAEAIEAYQRYRPDVTLMDLRLPDLDGTEVIRRIRETDTEARVVVLTTETGDALIQRAIDAGAKGYVLKGMAMGELLTIIRSVAAGRTSIPGLVATHIAAHIGDKALTSRETEVLRLIAAGHRNKAVGASLSISEETVKMHVKNCMAKLGANDRTHAVTIAIQRGFISV